MSSRATRKSDRRSNSTRRQADKTTARVRARVAMPEQVTEAHADVTEGPNTDPAVVAALNNIARALGWPIASTATYVPVRLDEIVTRVQEAAAKGSFADAMRTLVHQAAARHLRANAPKNTRGGLVAVGVAHGWNAAIECLEKDL